MSDEERPSPPESDDPAVSHFADLNFQIDRFFATVVGEYHPAIGVQSGAALDCAQNAHAGQERDEGGPYLIHPVRVANCLIYEAQVSDPDLIIAGLLHDVVEDAGVEFAFIRDRFCAEVARLVQNVTRQRTRGESLDEKYAAKLVKLDWIREQDRDTRLLKTADVLDNLRSWRTLPVESPAFAKHEPWFRLARDRYCALADAAHPALARAVRDALAGL